MTSLLFLFPCYFLSLLSHRPCLTAPFASLQAFAPCFWVSNRASGNLGAPTHIHQLLQASCSNPSSIVGTQRVGPMLGNLGSAPIVFHCYQFAGASKHLGRATLGDCDPATLASVNNLALLLQARGRPEAAEPLCREAVEASRDAQRSVEVISWENDEVSCMCLLRILCGVILTMRSVNRQVPDVCSALAL